MKVEFNCELTIIGTKEGDKKSTKGKLGSLLCESEDGLLYTGVGAGLSHELRDELWNKREELIGKIVEVKANGISTNKHGGTSLFFPAFIEIREDKTKSDTLETIKEIEESALGLKEEL